MYLFQSKGFDSLLLKLTSLMEFSEEVHKVVLFLKVRTHEQNRLKFESKQCLYPQIIVPSSKTMPSVSFFVSKSMTICVPVSN